MFNHPFVRDPESPGQCRCGAARGATVHKVDSTGPFWNRGKTSGQIDIPTPLIVLLVVVMLGFFAYGKLQPQIDAVADWIRGAAAWVGDAVEWLKGRPR